MINIEEVSGNQILNEEKEYLESLYDIIQRHINGSQLDHTKTVLGAIQVQLENYIHMIELGTRVNNSWQYDTEVHKLTPRKKSTRPSIKEVTTAELPLSLRRDMITKYEPIPIGDVVYDSGDAFTPVQEVVVTKDNQNLITMFWNALYFEDYDAATRKHSMCTEDYDFYKLATEFLENI